MRRVLLHGSGRETRAAASFFIGQPDWEVACFDDGGGSLEGAAALSREQAFRYAVGSVYLRSPGAPPTNELVAFARQRAEIATTPTGFWLENLAVTGTITVTGTKGKSTTSAIIAATLAAAGATSHAYGNIGEPPLSAILPHEEYPVVELSSYMMHDLPLTGHFHLVTSLFEDHLDWHGDRDAYHAAKLRPFRHALPAPGIAPRAVIDAHGLPASVHALEDLVVETDNALLIGGHVIDCGPEARGFRRGPLRIALRMAAAVAARIVGDEAAAKAASAVAHSFEGLPSRQQIIPSTDGRIWVDDSLATIPQAAVEAVTRFHGRTVVLIVGGGDRGIDYTPLNAFLRATPNVQAIGFAPAAERMSPLAARAATLEDAIDAAAELCPQGGVILFAPAAPSSPPHKNYEERSAVFRACVARVSCSFSG